MESGTENTAMAPPTTTTTANTTPTMARLADSTATDATTNHNPMTGSRYRRPMSFGETRVKRVNTTAGSTAVARTSCRAGRGGPRGAGGRGARTHHGGEHACREYLVPSGTRGASERDGADDEHPHREPGNLGDQAQWPVPPPSPHPECAEQVRRGTNGVVAGNVPETNQVRLRQYREVERG